MSINFTELGIPSPRTFITGYILITILELWEQIFCKHPTPSRRSAAAWNVAHRERKKYIKNSFWQNQTSRRSDAAWYIFFKTVRWQFQFILLSDSNEQFKNQKKTENILNPIPCLRKEKNRFLQHWETETSRRSGAAWYVFLNPRRWQLHYTSTLQIQMSRSKTKIEEKFWIRYHV
jgi:hypothetical protein